MEGREEGIAIGEERGKQEGEKNKQLEIARKMIFDKMDVEIISKYSGLSPQEIKNLENYK